MFYNSFFYFFSSRDLRGPWTDFREILPHVRKHVQFIKAAPKLWESTSKKIWGGQKHAKFGAISDTFPLWTQLSSKQIDMQNPKTWCTTAFPPTFNKKLGEFWSTNYGDLEVHTHKIDFLGIPHIFGL